MNTRNKRTALLAVMMIALLSAVLVLLAAAATTWDVYEGESIQAALDNTSDGDTVFVHAGTYPLPTTNLHVDTPNITVKGEGADVVTLSGTGGSAFFVGASSPSPGCIVEGFLITYEGGVYIYDDSSPNCIIRNNVIKPETSSNNPMYTAAPNTTIKNNVIDGAKSYLKIYGSDCKLIDNRFSNIKSTTTAVYLYSHTSLGRSDRSYIANNTIINCAGTATSSGAILVQSGDSVFINNTIINNTGNAIWIWKTTAANNTFTRNNFSSNGGILYLRDAGEGNKIYLNNIVDNTAGVYYYGTSPTTTYWNSTEPIEYSYGGATYTNYLGNYWGSDYTGTDSDGDGIGDTPYDIPGSATDKDYRPLMAPFEEYLGEPPAPAEVIYDGTVTLFDGTFTWYDSYSGDPHVVATLTPHGALETASADAGFDYGGSWKGSKNTALIDWIDDYYYNDTSDWTWNYQLNGVYQNYFSDVTGVSNNPVGDGDFIEFYYGPDQETTENAVAFVRMTVEEANAAVYFDPDDIRVPAYCNTTTVGVWVNPVIAMGSGQLTFNYTFCCLNVTDFAPDLTNFDAVANPGSLCTAVLTPGQVRIGFATTATGGLGPGPVHIGDLTFHCCHESGEYCETDLEWVPGYPDSYVESADNGEIAPVLYDDGVFRCNIPDLVITSVMGKKVDDTHYTVNYTIKNVGAAIAAAGHVTSLTVDGIEVETKAVPDALAPGEEKEYAFDSVIEVSDLFDTITVCADCEDDVIELDEENNCMDGRYPAEVVVSVIPAETIVQPQDQFDVKIHIDPRGQEILGIQYTLTYDTSVLRAETQTKGPFLGSGTIIVVNEIDQANGIVQYAETRTGETGVTVADNVSTIHFIAIGERADTSALTLSDVIVVDVNKEETEVVLEDGMVEITENQPPIPIGQSKFLINNVAKKYPSTAILCSCSYDPDWPGKGGNITYIRWAFGDGQYGTSEGLPVDNCTCKEHKYESWLWNTTTEAYDNFTVLLTVTDDGCPEATESTEFPITVYIAGDANGDGEVNIIDAVWVGKHWRDTAPATDYCEDCTGYLWFDELDEHWAQKDGADLNNDCEINILDAVVIGANWRHVAWE